MTCQPIPDVQPATIRDPVAEIAPLLAPLSGLAGIPPRLAPLLTKLVGGNRVVDLLFHLPTDVIDRRDTVMLSVARNARQPGAVLTVTATITGVSHPARPRQPLRVHVRDETDEAELVFFGPNAARRLRAGDVIAVSGPFDLYAGRIVFRSPDYVVPAAQIERIPLLDPVWPLTAGVFHSSIANAMRRALACLPEALPEWLDKELVRRRRWPGFAQAIRILQSPGAVREVLDATHWASISERARSRLACDEVLADQLCLALARVAARNRAGRAMSGNGTLRTEALRRFGFAPTGAQTRAVGQIGHDMAQPRQMMRLLQGDVGAGKTLVAALAMLQAVESGAQAALMAPTEILARQHFATLERLCPTEVAFLSGSVTGRMRREALARIADGRARIVVGTHALFQDKVAFADLGLAVIDEQHRFGVEQRLVLGAKGLLRADGSAGVPADILVMTATPIPRTLLLTQWGDMQVSRLDEKPPGRSPVRTSIHPMASLNEVTAGIGRALAQGVQVFWVCPLIEESAKLDAAAAEARWASLTQIFPKLGADGIGLAHGRQDIAVREDALLAFREGRTRCLVATTVIEVGVDIPSASVMVIEHAERFGLAQLHQLRGRVGRGHAQSFCLLLFDEQAAQTGRRRLALLRDTEDGFVIADEDFRTRGGGDLAGSRQSGLPGFRLATGARLDLLVTLAAQDSARVIETDPGLKQPRGQAIRLALAMFDRATPGRILSAG